MTMRMNQTAKTIPVLFAAAWLNSVATATAEECANPCTVSAFNSPQFNLVDESAGATDWAIRTINNGTAFNIGRLGQTGIVRIEAGAASSLLTLDSAERIGINTSTPVEELDIRSPLPGIHLEDTSPGAGLAEIELSTNVFRIEGNTGQAVLRMNTNAPGGSLRIDPDGDVLIGTNSGQSGDGTLHVRETDADLHDRVLVRIAGSNFAPQFEYRDGSTGSIWRQGMNNGGHFVINQMNDPGVAELRISPGGQVFVNGNQAHPDYVFEEDYELMPLTELERFVREKRHLPGVVSSEDAGGKVDLSSFPLQLLEKIEELSLYTIQQERTIQELRAALEDRMAMLEEKIHEQRVAQ